MTAKQVAHAHNFPTEQEYYDYIYLSFKNGQRAQAFELFTYLPLYGKLEALDHFNEHFGGDGVILRSFMAHAEDGAFYRGADPIHTVLEGTRKPWAPAD